MGRTGELTNLKGRSPRTVALAAQAEMIDVGDDATLVREADLLLSVLVPAQASAFAERMAAAMRATHSTPLFADCNAISPRTALSIERLLREVGAEVVDVGIIGVPSRVGRAETRLYASGPCVERLAVLNEYGLDVRVIGPLVASLYSLTLAQARQVLQDSLEVTMRPVRRASSGIMDGLHALGLSVRSLRKAGYVLEALTLPHL